MRSGPRKLSTEEELYAAAMRALMRRAYSVFEMRTFLERRSEDAGLARHVVTRIRQEKYLDDARYALDFARAHAKLRRQGRYRIMRELRVRGVPDKHIEAAIEQTFSETDETVVVRKVIERRLRAARGPFDQKKLASLYRMLQRAGFDSQLIQRELRGPQRKCCIRVARRVFRTRRRLKVGASSGVTGPTGQRQGDTTMIDDILMAISVGRRVIKTLGNLKNDVDSFRSNTAKKEERYAQMEALDKRTGDLEILAKEQNYRLREIEDSLKDALVATEAVAERVGTIYWMALVSCVLGATALILCALSLTLRR